LTPQASHDKRDTVLVIVAHTDDETLGAGGALARHAASGDRVFGYSLTDGVGARNPLGSEASRARLEAAKRAASILGFEWLDPGDFPDNALDSVPLLSIVKHVEIAKTLVAPSIVYTHSPADLNIDHTIVARAVLTAFRPQPGEILRELRAIEVPSATDYGHRGITGTFQPNLYVDVSDTWARKREALECYADEMREAPHSRSVEGVENLARLRGNQVGLRMAEAFEVIRRIER
jgi:LmbE family N-acetylglucosaminyl deacetylase